MNIVKSVCLVLSSIIVFSCGDNRFPMDKRYWTPEEYQNAIFQIEYHTPEGEEFPRLSNPETAPIFRKLVDAENYKVVLEDSELGLNFKNEMSDGFFAQYRNLSNLYRVMDKQDKYVYPDELIEIDKFGLGLQILYFSLGNERIKKESDSPEAPATIQVLSSNQQTIIKNFNVYLDHIGDEGRFGSSVSLLAEGITTHFYKLIETFPDGNYSTMASKARAMMEKTQVAELKTVLGELLARIESVKKPEQNE